MIQAFIESIVCDSHIKSRLVTRMMDGYTTNTTNSFSAWDVRRFAVVDTLTSCGIFTFAMGRRVRWLEFEQTSFRPICGEWVYRQIKDWSEKSPNGCAYLHVFRKTILQFADSGEYLEKSVAVDASVSASVLMANYGKVGDQELRHKTN